MGEKKGKRTYTFFATPERVAKINPKNLELVDKFLMGKRNLSETTRKAYKNDLDSFLVYVLLFANNDYIFDWTAEEAAEIIDEFISYVMGVLGNNERRASRRTSSISSLYIFYKKRRKIKENPVELLDRVRAVAGQYESHHTFLTLEQVEKIREQLKEKSDVQMELYVEFALFSMLRISALTGIMLEQIDFEKKIITGIREKEGYIISTFLNDKLIELIQRWINERKEKGIESDLLFCNKNGENLKSTIQTRYTELLSKWAGVEGVTCHALRRSGSNLRLEAGQDLQSISKLLNHKSTSTTQQHYILENFDALRNDAEQFAI